jgi:hypothetical protein
MNGCCLLAEARSFSEKRSLKSHTEYMRKCPKTYSAMYLILVGSQEIKKDQYQGWYEVLMSGAIQQSPASGSGSPYGPVLVVSPRLTAHLEALAAAFKERYREP